ncbi:MAG: zinc ribbon domain-containing protein [Promethearchaeota archaeon]
MVIHFESSGNFNSGSPSFRALISKKARVNIQINENKISFQSEIDKIRYDVKLSNIKGYSIRERNRISVIELIDLQENLYTFFPLLNKYSSRSNSKRLTEDLFNHITRLYVKNETPILFEAKGAFWEGDPSLSNWKSNLNNGRILLTENYISFKPFREERLYQIKVLDIKEIVGESKDLDLFIKIITNQNRAFSFLLFKKRFKFYTRDKIKTEKFLELLKQVRIYKDSEQIRLFELEKKRIEKIKSMIKVSNRIKLEMMRIALEMDEKNFTNKVFEWAKKFDFIIDGEYLVVNNENVNDFILSLKVNEYIDINKVKCPFCENIIEAEVLICPYCGKEIKI